MDDIEPFTLTSVGGANSSPQNLTANTDPQETCKRAAAKLGIVWPEALIETTTSHYEGKRLPKAKSSTRQFLPVFPECRWLNPSSLSQTGKTDLLDVPVDPKGLFGPAVATMLKRCKEKKRESEALLLCLPSKVPTPPATASCQKFDQTFHIQSCKKCLDSGSFFVILINAMCLSVFLSSVWSYGGGGPCILQYLAVSCSIFLNMTNVKGLCPKCL